MNRITRRSFMKGSLLSAAGVGFASTMAASAPSQIRGANDDIRVAVIGFRGKGAGHISGFHKLEGVRVVALCDVDQTIIDLEVKKFAGRNEKVDTYTDIRKLLEDKNIDAVVIATPNHWHALATIWACQAGKDVYVEKPIHHNIAEGGKMMAAAKKYNRIVQSGTQGRSDTALHESAEFLQSGKLGKILYAHCLCYNLRGSIGKVNGPQQVPDYIDYDLWCGPSPFAPLMRQRLHYDWHWFWDTGSTDLGNQAIHEMDICRWLIGQDKLCKRVMSIGGRFGYVDDGQTPNTQVAFLDYDPAPIIFEMRGLPTKKGIKGSDRYKGINNGAVIQCENGYWAGSRGGGWAFDNNDKKIKQFAGDAGGGHDANFIKAVRSRKESDLNAPLIEGHLSSSLCHLANISHRLGAITPYEQIRDSAKNNEQVAKALDGMKTHLAANEVDVNSIPITQGPMLELDEKREKFIGDFPAFWANQLLTRTYREPFVIRDQV